MPTKLPSPRSQSTTTEMQVTSIRFERELIDKLKDLAGTQGYQSLVREILWNYVSQQTGEPAFRIKREDIRTVMVAEARQQEQCALTGDVIEPYEEMWMAYLTNGQLAPLSLSSLEDEPS